MTRTTRLVPAFVEYIPKDLDDATLYVSIAFATAVHRCCCGCGTEVVTPLSPTDWRLEFDGAISLYPSIGNWSFECRSHYWIRRNSVQWAPRWSDKKIEAGRTRDRATKERFFQTGQLPRDGSPSGETESESHGKIGPSVWQRITRRWLRH